MVPQQLRLVQEALVLTLFNGTLPQEIKQVKQQQTYAAVPIP